MKKTDITYQIPTQPRQLRIDSTTLCNAACRSCHRFLSKRKGMMSTDLIRQILDDVSRWATPLTEIVPINYGELPLRLDWIEILQMITRKLPHTQIVLPTNGSYYDEWTVKRLAEIPTLHLVNFSVNAYFDETYEAFMGLKASTIPNIEKAIKLLKTLRPDITIWASMVFNPLYASDLERDLFVEYWKSKVDTAWVIQAASCNRPNHKVEIIRYEPCRSLFSDIVVGYDDKLSSCCFDAGMTLDLGEYSGDLLKDWRNPKLEELRRIHNEHRRETVSLCSSCTFA